MMNVDIQPSWRDSALWGCLLIAAYICLAALPLALAYWVNPSTDESLTEELGLGTALLGFSLLALQFALSARIPWIDQPFGLDLVMRFHKGMAIFAGILILSHPLLIAYSHGNWALLGFGTPWTIDMGKIALVLLVLTILLALYFSRVGMDYNVWRVFHKGAPLILIFGFIHSYMIGDDLQNAGMKAYWIALFGLAMLIFLFRNLYAPIFGRRRFRVAGVERESHDTWTLSFEPEDGVKPIIHRPGQFWFLKLKRPGRPSELHPFTISSAPTTEPPLTSTIKESGNFTKTIGQTKPGDRARIEGPFGRFSLVNYRAESYLFIAGGVGITPIMSMLRYLRDTGDGRAAVLLYGNNSEDDILFRKELAQMSERVETTHVLAKPGEDWQGPQGNITKELISEKADGLLKNAHVYLCGPPAMMDSIIPALKELGVPGSRINFERFSI